MLQIITGKFFNSAECYETLHRAVLFTNYVILDRNRKMVTPINVLLPTAPAEGVSAIICEVTEKIEKYPDGEKPGVLISTGGHALLNDIAAVTAFALNITCTTDPDLTRRLLATERPSLGVGSVPNEFIKRTFDRRIVSKNEDETHLSSFMSKILGLRRDRYEKAIRAIRQYVNGLHRIADDLSLSYTQIIMSIESLIAKNDGGSPAAWNDYDQQKKAVIDRALKGASADVRDNVRKAILSIEHVAVSQRFKRFALDHIDDSFFREEAVSVDNPISRGDLAIALQQVYNLRSQYVHSLREIPSQLTIGSVNESVNEDGRVVLTIPALARVARHIIFNYIERGESIKKESFAWWNALPNTVRVNLAPECWIANPDGFRTKYGPLWLSGFLEQFSISVLLQVPGASITDIRPVLSVIEASIPSIRDRKQRLPLLSLYLMFNRVAGKDYHSDKWPGLVENYVKDFEEPTLESYICHILLGTDPPWSLENCEEIHQQYFGARHKKGVVKLGCLLESAILLDLAERYRRAGEDDRARDLIASAVDSNPGNASLRAYEKCIPDGSLEKIKWDTIILPKPLFN